MKILIVDDNANNRMILRLLLEDYGEDKNSVYEIDECTNGLEAVIKAKKEKYEIIFMDIMMPQMDGIEATKDIRHADKEVMIIAVSAVDDELRQKEILRYGAEDYVPKPIDAKLLKSRLDNYFALLKLRHNEGLSKHRKAANLYTNKILKRQTIFYVSSEEVLSEFWEYYLLESVSKIDGLSDVVRVIFSIGEAIVGLKGEPWIIVEADSDSIYFTINRIDVVGEMVIKLIMKKNSEVKDFMHNDEKLSFKLAKTTIPLPNVSTVEVRPVQTEEPASTTGNDIEIAQTNVSEYGVFQYMESDDLADVEDKLGDLSSMMLMLGNSAIEPAEVSEIIYHLDRLGRALSVYSESFAIGRSLINLSEGISTHASRFQEISGDLSSLSSAFVSDLQSWIKMTFYEGAPSVDFMNDTIMANTQLILSMLSEDESSQSAEDIDDIFDF